MACSLSQSRALQYLDNGKLSTRDREEYTGHENHSVSSVAAKPRSKKSSKAPALASHKSVFFSFPVEFHRDGGILYPVLLQPPITNLIIGKMEPSCPVGTTRLVTQEKFPQKPYNKSFIDQACSTPSRSINTQKKNSANIQPS